MAGTFEIYKDQRGEYRFRLKARNGEIVALARRGVHSRPVVGGLMPDRTRAQANLYGSTPGGGADFVEDE